MIKEQDLLDAIAECQGERNPNANTCIKLAAYYTILNNIKGPETYSLASPPEEVYDSGSEFAEANRGKDREAVIRVMDELMDTISMLIPKLYRATIDKINDL